jgi:hypothetical protein
MATELKTQWNGVRQLADKFLTELTALKNRVDKPEQTASYLRSNPCAQQFLADAVDSARQARDLVDKSLAELEQFPDYQRIFDETP